MAEKPKTTPGVSEVWFAEYGIEVRQSLRALGELLTGVVKPAVEDTEMFSKRVLGIDLSARMTCASVRAAGVAKICICLAVAEIADKAIETGPGRNFSYVRWGRVEISGDTILELPESVALHMGPDVTEAPGVYAVIRCAESPIGEAFRVEALTLPEFHREGRALLDRLVARGRELNPYRNRLLKVNFSGGDLSFDVLEPGGLTRTDITMPTRTWTEIDNALAMVTTHSELLGASGLSCSPSMMLCGPPGTGKTALAKLISDELVEKHGFTSMYVSAKLLSAGYVSTIIETAVAGLSPYVIIADDLDLYQRERHRGGSAELGDLLQALDSRPHDVPGLVIVTTNDMSVFDPAAVRASRLGDIVIETTYPDTASCATILGGLIKGLPGGDGVDTRQVAISLRTNTTAADLSALTRRCVVVNNGVISTDSLIGVARDGSYLPAHTSGQYL